MKDAEGRKEGKKGRGQGGRKWGGRPGVPPCGRVCSGKVTEMCLTWDQSSRPGAEQLWLSMPPCLYGGWEVRHLQSSST